MKNEKVSCLLWLCMFLALCGASGWFVSRRAPESGPAFFGGFIGGILLLLVLAYLIAIPQRIWEWLLIVRTKLGREPADGSRHALIGTLRGHGDLTAPFSRRHCAAYEYDVHMRVVTRSGNRTTVELKKVYQGFAMVPLSIEHGTDRTRILAKPEIVFETSRLDGTTSLTNAREYIENTSWVEGAPPPGDDPDLARTDGHYRRDYRLRDDAQLDECTFTEKILTANTNACAIGTYSQDKRALLAPVKVRTGESPAISAAWRIVSAGIGAVIFAAITLAAAAAFCANFPLDAAESANPDRALMWPEIELERFIAKEVRPRMVNAGMLTSDSGFYLQDVCMNCAKGQLIVDGRIIELKHAAYIGDTAVHISAKPGDRDGLTLSRSDKVTMTLDGKTAPIPSSWFLPNDVVTSLGSGPTVADYAGRITIVSPDRWLRARVTFKTRVASDDWLRDPTPPAPQ